MGGARTLWLLWWHRPRIMSRCGINHVLAMKLRRCLSVGTERRFICEVGLFCWNSLLILFLKLPGSVDSLKVIVKVGQSVRYEIHATLKACSDALISRLLIARPTFPVNLVILTFHEWVHVSGYVDSILVSMAIYSIFEISTFARPFHQSCLLLVLTSAIECLELLLSLPSLRDLSIRFGMNYCRMERRRYLRIIIWCYICSRWGNLRNQIFLSSHISTRTFIEIITLTWI